jgi:hypothetical protein
MMCNLLISGAPEIADISGCNVKILAIQGPAKKDIPKTIFIAV